MTNIFERRIRKLEARTSGFGRNAFVFGLPGRPDPDPADIGPDDTVLTLSFVGSRDGQLAQEAHHARD